MDEVLATFARWRETGRNVAVATIVHVQGSALRLAGAAARRHSVARSKVFAINLRLTGS